ncbi:MAG TPA: hypothetical protein VJ622_14710 [Acidimicrobiia bacterium]|nr:hypothetical protein [Acidimicrobiia bacterium]
MITADEVMPLLLSACPSFVPKWEAVAGENVDEDDPSKRLCYLDAGDFIRHLVELRLAGRIEEMPAVFEVIERLHVEGDHYVRELATIGYLEGLQMRTVTEAGLDPEQDFRPYFGPVSNKWWERLNRLWAGDASALREDDSGG